MVLYRGEAREEEVADGGGRIEIGTDLVGEFVIDVIDDVVGGHGLAVGWCWRRMFWLSIVKVLNAY
jgi:hypothetical protein